MAFRQSTYLARFNSATSSEFLNFYQNFVVQQIIDERSKKPPEMMSPSSFRCDRLCWFRIRGVEPDTIDNPDPVMQFKADVGTGCHRVIQRNLSQALKDDWIDVEQYLNENPMPWKYVIELEGSEYRIKIPELQFQMACDGIVRWKGKLYLLEVKTVEYTALEDMTDPRSDHVDQVKCYATMLGLDGVLFLYQDRAYGGLKCYEMSISASDKKTIIDKIERIVMMKEQNIAPDKLPPGDQACPYCNYKTKCKQWG